MRPPSLPLEPLLLPPLEPPLLLPLPLRCYYLHFHFHSRCSPCVCGRRGRGRRRAGSEETKKERERDGYGGRKATAHAKFSGKGRPNEQSAVYLMRRPNLGATSGAQSSGRPPHRQIRRRRSARARRERRRPRGDGPLPRRLSLPGSRDRVQRVAHRRRRNLNRVRDELCSRSRLRVSARRSSRRGIHRCAVGAPPRGLRANGSAGAHRHREILGASFVVASYATLLAIVRRTAVHPILVGSAVLVFCSVNPSFVIWCMSGLENALYTFTILLLAYATLRALEADRRRSARSSYAGSPRCS